MDLPYIKTLRWESSLTYDASNVITYNLAIGAQGSDLPRVWEAHPEFHALPTFAASAVVNIMGKVTRDMPVFLPTYQPSQHPHVHSEHYLETKRPFPSGGATLVSVARIKDVVARRTGVAVVVAITTTDAASGTEICYNEWTSFLIGMSGEGLTPFTATTTITEGDHSGRSLRPPDATISHQTSREQAALYRAATAEWNPMHISPEHGRQAGFPGPILTGTCTIGIGVRHVIDTVLAGQQARFKSVRLRLSKPVFPGEIVQTQLWKEEADDCIRYQQVTLDGRVVISQAVVHVAAEENNRNPRSQL
ncbi:hypothetical protein FE257_009861 [Aspergillus nanangensis]|uniref:MaoC-like domain-containing protein n=1 Tax=Aspergillus nanangensis TaxID=2582783 RepID=A0AAD4CWC0_ASPNN|nr:hypothetical protein FE257_009861 [Aspergillus nanangensis]